MVGSPCASSPHALLTNYSLTAIVTIWQAEIVSMNEQLFNGSKENTDLLFTAITDGQMLETKHQDLGVDAIQALVSKALFAELVPLSWQLSSSELGPVYVVALRYSGLSLTSLLVSSIQSKAAETSLM